MTKFVHVLISLVMLRIISVNATGDSSIALSNAASAAIPREVDRSHLLGVHLREEYLSPMRGGDKGVSTGNRLSMTSPPTRLFMQPRFLFKIQALGTASFGIPALVAPALMHPVFATGAYPKDNTFYVYMFAIRECYLASVFGMAAFMPAKTLKSWQLWSIIVLTSHTIMNIFHSGWNPMVQVFVTCIHAIILVLNAISYQFAPVEDTD
uniref:Uncharacterized protein n=1 Tax=Attheya septentrionalis TaxID=420275 RepID=A0A7S2UTI5_9STRA|mmetsp:Transcript_843/g.1566  ORF Transcript_843/g.1566 Transcript_843/m.1566 type:complete len:209 (+) Transcript_843:943-1569(+)